MEELESKKKRKVAINNNQTFAGIAKTMAAQQEKLQRQKEKERHDRAAEARETAEAMLQEEISKFQAAFFMLRGGPPHMRVWRVIGWRSVDSPVLAAALLSSFKHPAHHGVCHASIVFPGFTGFLDPVRSFP